jgi:type IV pilus assembly protein PilC
MYAYIAYNRYNLRVTGVSDCEFDSDLFDSMSSRHLFLDSYIAVLYNTAILSEESLLDFCGELSFLYSNGVTLLDALRIISSHSSNTPLRNVVSEMFKLFQSGFTFSEIISIYKIPLTSYFCKMLVIGDKNGTLESVLKYMSDFFDKRVKTKLAVKHCVSYSLVLSVLSVALVVFLVVSIFPVFNSMLSMVGTELPFIVRSVYSIALFISERAVLFGVSFVVLSFAFYRFLKSAQGHKFLDYWLVNIPLVKHLVYLLNVSKFTHSLYISICGGVELVQAVKDSADLIENSVIGEKFNQIYLNVENGIDLYDAMITSKLFDDIYLQFIHIGQTTGRLESMLLKVSELVDSCIDKSISKIIRYVEPLSMAIIAVVIISIVLSVLIPMISIMNNIG